MSSDHPLPRRPWNVIRLRDLLTAPRLHSYLAHCNGDLDGAIRLYEWNLRASAAVIQTSAMVEVIVRNALDGQLTDWAIQRGRGSWLDQLPLDKRGREDVGKAIDRATRSGKVARVHGKVVAELSIGFWRYLTASRYHASLWVPSLHRAFPNGATDLRHRRMEVERLLAQLVVVRNRAAHHEPIHRRNLMDDLQGAVDLATWVHRDAGLWVAATSMLPETLEARPAL